MLTGKLLTVSEESEALMRHWHGMESLFMVVSLST